MLIVDLLLLAALVLALVQVRGRWLEARKREAVVLGRRVKPVPPPAFVPLSRERPAAPAAYNEIAQKMLFSKDRNPTVVVEPAPPPIMPPLPALYGVLNLGDGPAAIMAAKAGEMSKEFHPGDTIGEFKLLRVGADTLAFEWNGQEIVKKTSELVVKVQVAEAAPPRMSNGAPAPVANTDLGPGRDIGGGKKACQPGDSTPAGTIRAGMKKVIVHLPIGQNCRWEPQ